jgi:pimeloyl-ACP methyl ester carboxylesterase
MRRSLILLSILAALVLAPPAGAQYPWMRLPPTPALPKPGTSGIAPVNGIRLWYAEFGHGTPVILVHGGLANSDYWGLQVPALAAHYHVIVLDSRGHGRSTGSDAPIGYDLMSSDILALMDYLHIRKAALVGWSDGAIIGLDIAIHHPDRLTQLFAFAANSNPSGVKDVNQSPVFTAYIQCAAKEYAQLSPTPTASPSRSEIHVGELRKESRTLRACDVGSDSSHSWLKFVRRECCLGGANSTDAVCLADGPGKVAPG